MHHKFNKTYIANTTKSVAMVVVNGVVGDSRVLKTASTLVKLGYQVDVYGISGDANEKNIDGYPFNITLLSNPAVELKKNKKWWIKKPIYNIQAFVEGLCLVF